MATYRYKAVNAAGETVTDVIEAASPDQAGERLAAKGLVPLRLKAQASRGRAAGKGTGGGKVTDQELILFTTQLATMLRAGVPILRAVEILESEADNRRLKSVCNAMAADIRGGLPLNTALRRHTEIGRAHV